GAVRVRGDRPGRAVAPALARDPARDGVDHRAAADPPAGQRAVGRLRADPAAAADLRRRGRADPGHVRLLPRHQRRRLGPGDRGRAGPGADRQAAGARGQPAGQGVRRGGRVLMATTTKTLRPAWQEKPKPITQVLKVLILVVCVVVMLYPFVHVISVSFSDPKVYTPGDLLLWPKGFTTAAYELVLGGEVVPRALLVSIGVTVLGTLISMVMTVTMAYGLTQTKRVPGSRFILLLVLFSMLFSAGIIPNYLVVRGLGLLDNYLALILPGAISAFNLVVIRNFFMGIPEELMDAARIDGAGELRILLRVVLPLSKAVLAVIALFYGVGYW